MPLTLQTPGVYINEINAFPNSVVPVATAVPAFIGYTARASYNGKSYSQAAVRIESFPQFMAYYGALDPTDPSGSTYLPENLQYSPTYYPTVSKTSATADVCLGGKYYDIEPDPNTVYYLYNSIKLFYANGGGTCYVVSVGLYSDGVPKGSPMAKGTPLVNTNIDVTLLTAALDTLKAEDEPTMIVIPDATLLKAADNTSLNTQVLAHCGAVQSRVGLIDILNGNAPDPLQWEQDIATFRTNIGLNFLNYGITYYPFLKTAVMIDRNINFKNIGGGSKTLNAVISGAAAAPIKGLIASIDAPGGASPLQIENALLNTSNDYSQLHDAILAKMNILPPSAAMARVYTMVDSDKGVWHAPANVSLDSVIDTTVKITHDQQQDLNVDAGTGKSVNAIRLFPGKGVVVWGARTLDGNSDDWRYVNVRRTLIMIEQSMKLAANAYVFEPNTANTWSLVTSMLNNFLTNLWSQGALVGATPAAAFSVLVGLGSTMTAEDILQGIMNVSVKVAISHPAEFIVLNIQQEMQTS
jgi:uncharacterized protein